MDILTVARINQCQENRGIDTREKTEGGKMMEAAKDNYQKKLNMEQLGKVIGGFNWNEIKLSIKAVWNDYCDVVCEQENEHPFSHPRHMGF